MVQRLIAALYSKRDDRTDWRPQVAQCIFLSMPTSDLARSQKFYEGAGWKINPAMSDDNGICVVVSETIYFMLMTREFMSTFTQKSIVDPSKSLQVQAGLTADSREEVDDLIARVVAAGGTETEEPQDYGFMYSRDFEDPDGNHFAIFWMNPEGQGEETAPTQAN